MQKEPMCISIRFTNWKEATSRFASHGGSRCHKDVLLSHYLLLHATSEKAFQSSTAKKESLKIGSAF